VLNYYIYYRVHPNYRAEAEAAVHQIQFEIEGEMSIPGRLLRKRDEPLLWMEVYENVAAGDQFEGSLAKAEKKAGLVRYLQDGATRHVECFQS
jgi:hypothetical protein